MTTPLAGNRRPWEERCAPPRERSGTNGPWAEPETDIWGPDGAAVQPFPAASPRPPSLRVQRSAAFNRPRTSSSSPPWAPQNGEAPGPVWMLFNPPCCLLFLSFFFFAFVCFFRPDWEEEQVSSPSILRLIYQGRFLHGNVTLGGESTLSRGTEAPQCSGQARFDGGGGGGGRGGHRRRDGKGRENLSARVT